MSTKLFDLAENFVKFQRVFTENAAFQEQCIGRACSVPDFAEAVNTLVGIDANKGTRTWAGFHNSRNAKICDLQLGRARVGIDGPGKGFRPLPRQHQTAQRHC